jgi:hypothetical protein
MARSKTLQANGELNVAGANNVLNLEVLIVLLAMATDDKSGTTYGELCVEPQLLDNPRIFAGSKAAIVFRLGTSHNHLSTRKDQSRCLGLANTHDDGSETLWIVLGITCVQGDGLQVKASGEVDSSDDVLESGHDARRHLTILGIGSSRRSRNAVRIVGLLLRVLLRGRWSQVPVVGIREGARSHELGENVRTDWCGTNITRAYRLGLSGGGRVRVE